MIEDITAGATMTQLYQIGQIVEYVNLIDRDRGPAPDFPSPTRRNGSAP
jgi:hypothetical protein